MDLEVCFELVPFDSLIGTAQLVLPNLAVNHFIVNLPYFHP